MKRKCVDRKPLADKDDSSTPKLSTYREKVLAGVSYNQACGFLQAIEINRQRSLSPNCVAYLANYVARSWEAKPEPSRVYSLMRLMTNLLATTAFNSNRSLMDSLQIYCERPLSMPTICPSVTLLIAVSYIQRLKQKYIEIKGTTGCGSRLIMVAYIMASKFLHDNLRTIIHTTQHTPPPSKPTIPATNTNSSLHLITPPTSPKAPVKESTVSTSVIPCASHPIDDRAVRIMRMEIEFLEFINYDLSVNDPIHLVLWAQTFDKPEDFDSTSDDLSADDGDDEMDDNDQDDL
ncbi:hypothetical protein CLU79DRAFT_717409 [Phycomyces nitens]|nr:hypothetical protein CLU79DRAFT_717409 [Phycomyces nitens]